MAGRKELRTTGYELGYESCDCFWGDVPASFVQEALQELPGGNTLTALDLGCGEGKNAAFLAKRGVEVMAVELSGKALSNAQSRFGDLHIQWVQADFTTLRPPTEAYDLVIATGSMHCLDSREEIDNAVRMMQLATRVNGLNVLYAFNDGPHDFSGHGTNFRPCLLSHEHYVSLYEGWEMLRESNCVQDDAHPNTKILHSHSISRLLFRKK